MDKNFFPQPVDLDCSNIRENHAYLSPTNSHHESEPGMGVGQCENSEDLQRDCINTTTSNAVLNDSLIYDKAPETAATSENNIVSKLYEDYKSVSEELSSSLREFRSEKISLENNLGRLTQENEYLKLEIDRQKAHINDMNEISRNLSETLTKDEAQTKKIVELKLLEIQDIFGSIDSADKYMNNFKENFSVSVSEAQKFCENIKNSLNDLKDGSLKASHNYLSNFNNYISSCSEELNQIKKNITETKLEIEKGIDSYKVICAEEAKFKLDLNDLLTEIECEQKRKKELENGLLHYSNLIAKANEDHCNKLNIYEAEVNNLTRQTSELNLSTNTLSNKISATEEDILNLNGQHVELSSGLNTLQAILVRKRHDDEIIQQEIEKLEKQAEILRKDCDVTHEEVKRRKSVQVELIDLENQVACFMEKCKDLEKARELALTSNPWETLAAREQSLEQAKTFHQQMSCKVESSKNQLKEIKEADRILTEEVNTLRDDLNKKLTCLENTADGEHELEDIRRKNEELSFTVNNCELNLERKKKMVSTLQEFLHEQNQIHQELEDEFIHDSEMICDNEEDMLFEKYLSTLKSMDELQVDNLDDRLRRVSSAVDYNIKQKEETFEAYKNEMEKLQVHHVEIIKGLDKQVEEHKNHCDDMLAKLDSEMRYVQGKIPNIKDDIMAKKRELNFHAPKLANSVKTALHLFEKLVDYYTSACEERHSTETTSIHWDNTKEVLQEILLHPIHKLSKLRGMPYIDTLTATPQVYRTVISRAQQIFDHIINESEKKSTEYSCKKLMEMRYALYYQSGNDSPSSKKLNDTEYSSTTEDYQD